MNDKTKMFLGLLFYALCNSIIIILCVWLSAEGRVLPIFIITLPKLILAGVAASILSIVLLLWLRKQ